MNNITQILISYFEKLGLSDGLTSILIRITLVLGIVILAVIVDKICRKVVIPIVRKITDSTVSVWDDYLLSDDVLRNMCALIPPITIYAILPYLIPNYTGGLVSKLCWIYITVVSVKLVCSFITSIFNISS